MPAPWSAGAEIAIHGRIHGQETVNVLHFATNESFVDDLAFNTLLLQLLVHVAQCAVDTLLPAVSQDWTMGLVSGRRIAPAFSDVVENFDGNGQPGELGTTNVSFAASLVRKRTGGGGRSGRGRMFLPPAGDAAIVNSSLDPGTVALVTAFLTCLAGKFIGAGATTPWRLGVLSQKTFANTPANFNTAFRECIDLVPINEVAVMSSRKVGHGS